MAIEPRVMEIMRAAKWHAEHNIKKGDQVVVITSTTVQTEIPTAFASAAFSRGAEVVMATMRPPKVAGEQPPETIRAIMKAADVAITASSETLSFSHAMIDCIQSGGRHLSVPGASPETFMNGIVEVYFDEAEFQKMRTVAIKYSDALTKTNDVRIVTARGTDIRGSIKGRLPLPSYGIAEETYNHTSFPTGEVMIAPVEGTGEGKVVIDICMSYVGKINQPITIYFEGGKAVRFEGGDQAASLQRAVERLGNNSDNLAEFGFGINHFGVITGNKNQDKKILGTAHVALGSNYAFGGRLVEGIGGEVDAPCHMDGVMDAVTVYFDDEKVVEEGRLLL
ncbi:MAG: aminopeptidase [Patescibacteria group bacterium]